MSEPTLYDRIHEIDLRDRERIVKCALGWKQS